MKFISLPSNKLIRTIFPAFLLATLLTLALAFAGQTGHAQQAKLSLADILVALRSKKVTLVERNRILTDAVKMRGITFTITDEIEKELTVTGADKDLIQAIREKSVLPAPLPKIVAAAPPTPAPRTLDSSFFQNRANEHFVNGEYELAVADYSKAIEMNSADAKPYLSRARAYYTNANYESAIADYSKVIELDPKELAAYLNRADSFEKKGDMMQAAADYRKVIELDANNRAAKTHLATIQDALAKTQPKPKEPEPVAAVVKTPDIPTSVEVGAMNNLAVKLITPVYSIFDRQRNVQGLVTVQIILDEEGKVVSAKAVTGPSSLRAASEEAVKKTRFNPAKIGDKPVKATGFINFNFKTN